MAQQARPRQRPGPYANGSRIYEMGNGAQTQPDRQNEHGGAFTPPQQRQQYFNRPNEHGGAFVSSQPEQQYSQRLNEHGGAFIPSEPQQQYSHRPNEHGGAFVPSLPQQQYSNRPNDHGGAFVPSLPPQQYHNRQDGNGGMFEPAQVDHGRPDRRQYGGTHSTASPRPSTARRPIGMIGSAQLPMYQQDQSGQGQGTLPASGVGQQNKADVPEGYLSQSRGPSSSDSLAKPDTQWGGDYAYYTPRSQHQRGYRNLWNIRGRWRWKYPQAYQLPGLVPIWSGSRRHRDIFQRVVDKPDADQYLSPCDGHLAKLVVQSVDDVYDAQPNSTWRRTFVRNVSPLVIRMAQWPFSSIPKDRAGAGIEDWAITIGKWLVATCVLTLVLPYPTDVNGVLRNPGGCYDAFPYKFWGYMKYSRNHRESDPRQRGLGKQKMSESTEARDSAEDEPYHQEIGMNPIAERILSPRCLCFLNEPETTDLRGATPRNVKEWTSENRLPTHPDYLFIAYTTKQFQGDKDLQVLANLAERATRDAGLSAYWIGSSCLGQGKQLEEDVYRISDVVRGARGLAIIVGHAPEQRNTAEPVSTEQMLKSWGKSIWTLPEALLSPKGVPIRIYTRGFPDGAPMELLKANFARLAWDDARYTRQLMDHYEGSLILSPLELVVLALECLGRRDLNRNPYFDGDLSYVLMGLLRRRPEVHGDDSAFQAFARLSLANDSNMMLERLICVQPKHPGQLWLNTADAWDAKLWDIEPRCQVAGVGNDDTVLLDGPVGAAIRWKSFARVAYANQLSWRRIMAGFLLRSSPLIFYTATALIKLGFAFIGMILLLCSLVILLASPYLVRLLYTGKFWGTQAWFFGFEGYLDIETIESNIFGAAMGRLAWSPFGSPLSCHYNKDNECIGCDPTADPRVRAMVDKAKNSSFGEEKIFTLVDTNTMTVTMFSAVRPPVAVLLCGQEGGMQRAVMCSYDSSTQTLYREAVLRMETPIRQRMFRVSRFRFGFHRPLPKVQKWD